MKKLEHLSSIALIAGLGCFGLAGFVAAYLPIAHLSRIPYATLAEVAPHPSLAFLDLSERYPDAFAKHWGEPNSENFHAALRMARDQYIAEGCWHCHSQFVRPVSNESTRFGVVSYASEYMNEMFLPHLFGTRRVGPDLIREHERHSNDWHVAHFLDPKIVSPSSVMPRYPWFFDGDQPNKLGLAMVTYVQWLGSWATPEAIARGDAAREVSDEAAR
jgi:cbb3-type cytochrome c oxidase subunit II